MPQTTWAPVLCRPVVRLCNDADHVAQVRKDQVDLENAVIWIPDSKTPNGVAEVPLTDMALEALRSQIAFAGPGPYLFPSEIPENGLQFWHS